VVADNESHGAFVSLLNREIAVHIGLKDRFSTAQMNGKRNCGAMSYKLPLSELLNGINGKLKTIKTFGDYQKHGYVDYTSGNYVCTAAHIPYGPHRQVSLETYDIKPETYNIYGEGECLMKSPQFMKILWQFISDNLFLQESGLDNESASKPKSRPVKISLKDWIREYFLDNEWVRYDDELKDDFNILDHFTITFYKQPGQNQSYHDKYHEITISKEGFESKLGFARFDEPDQVVFHQFVTDNICAVLIVG
jgi:hypothetical protein